MTFHDDVYTRAAKLSAAFGPTGCEQRVLSLIEDELKDVCTCRYDRLGNLICRLPGTVPSTAKDEDDGAPERIAFICGVDEAGFMITKTDDKGYLRVESTGSADPACFIGKKMLAGNEETLFEGVGGGKVLHLISGSEHTDAPGFDKLFIDLGFEKKEELEGKLEPGDFAAYAGEYAELPGGWIVGKALETRLNCSLLVELLKSAARGERRRDLWAIFAVKEKVGYSGAVTALRNSAPDRAVLLGFEPSGDLNEKDDVKKGAVPGRGPVLTLKDGRALFYDSDFFKYAEACAADKQILDGGTSLSSSRGHLVGRGIPMISLRIPCFNPETPSVIVKKQDAENMLRMLRYLATGDDAEN